MPTILIAEDEVHIRRVMTMWLTRHGFEVLEAPNGAVALEVLRHQHVDLIVSDMNMPEMNGLTLIETVRRERGSDMPILLLSARCDQSQLADKVRPHGVRLYPKPFVPSRLVADIDELLATGSRSGGAE